MYASKIVIASALAALASGAAVINPRQIGNLQCNVARLKTVGALGDAGDAISDIQNADTKTAAQAGLDQANGGIKTIAGAILTGQQAPASGRDEVSAGLKAMSDALAAGDAADTAIADAKSAVDSATSAGQDVVDNCK